jgi:hypothetical protein
LQRFAAVCGGLRGFAGVCTSLIELKRCRYAVCIKKDKLIQLFSDWGLTHIAYVLIIDTYQQTTPGTKQMSNGRKRPTNTYTVSKECGGNAKVIKAETANIAMDMYAKTLGYTNCEELENACNVELYVTRK